MAKSWAILFRKIFLVAVTALFFPFVITLAFRGTITGTDRKGEMYSGRKILLDRHQGGYVDAEEYLVGLVACQMTAEYEPEALKAQAIIARTYLYRQMEEQDEMEESQLALEYMTENSLEKLWGKSSFVEYYEKVRQAVADTCGQVMVYDGELIEPLFHGVSAGVTRDGDEAHPYLKSVESYGDREAPDALTVTTWKTEDFTELIKRAPGGESLTKQQIPDSIQLIRSDGGGYVEEIQIGSHVFDGETVREALGLVSLSYTLTPCEQGVRAVCKGLGHGYGLSQFGANEKACDGMTAAEILSYYYQNIEIICL